MKGRSGEMIRSDKAKSSYKAFIPQAQKIYFLPVVYNSVSLFNL